MSMLRQQKWHTVVIFAVAICIVGDPAPTLAAADSPGTNCRPVTAADIAAGFPAGSVRCDSDRAVAPDASSEAKTYLMTRLVEPHRSLRPYYVTNFNPAFATCLATFMKEVESKGVPMLITSGARSYQDQQRAAANARPGYAAKPGRSPHERGLAADLKCNGSSSCASMRVGGETIDTIAKRNGLEFPLMPGKPRGRNITEEWHAEPASSQCATAGFAPANNGASENHQQVAGRFPTQGGANFLRGLLQGDRGATENSRISSQCAQLERACNEGNSGACTQFAQQCPQGIPAPSAPQGRAPSGAGTAGVPSQGTQGISQAFAPPTPPTPPNAPPVNSPATATGTSSHTLATTTPAPSEAIASIAVTTPNTEATATPKNPLPTTVVTYLAQEQVRVTPTASAPLPPPTTVLPPTYTPPAPTFGEASFDVTAQGSTYNSADRYAAIAQQLARARLLAESLLRYAPQPFSSERYHWEGHEE